MKNEHIKLAFFQHMIAYLVITIELTVKNVCALKRQPSVRDAQIRRRHHVKSTPAVSNLSHHAWALKLSVL